MEKNEDIIKELKTIKLNIEFIRNHMVDIDTIMTQEDYEALQEYNKEKNSGLLISHEALKKEIGL